MFERFTRDARAVVVLATEEARDRRDDHIGTEHLVIALAGHEPGRAVFQHLGVDSNSLRSALDSLDAHALGSLGIGAATNGLPRGPRSRRHIPFTSGAKACLEDTLRLVTARSEREIGCRHIGMVLASRGPHDQATLLLDAAGIEPPEVYRLFEESHPSEG